MLLEVVIILVYCGIDENMNKVLYLVVLVSLKFVLVLLGLVLAVWKAMTIAIIEHSFLLRDMYILTVKLKLALVQKYRLMASCF